MFLHVPVCLQPGLSYLISQGETAAVPLRCNGIRQVTFWENKRSFVATKVQLAWKILQRRAMSSRVLSCAKITVKRGFRTKCTTLFFKEHIILTGISRASDCRVYRIGFSSVYVYRGIQLSCNPRCGIGLTLVSSGRLCRFIHPLTIGNIIRLIDNRREKGNTDI